LLEGGLPLGSLAEITGPTCSGRSTLVSSILAGVTRQGAACAYVDVADAFDPFSAAAIGINLGRLLWLRAGRCEESGKPHSKAWTRLDQALRATDWVLNTGGFRVIVLDMGDVRAEQVRRVPLASWYRYHLLAENSQALFLVMSLTRCANSCASVVLHCNDVDEQWEHAAGSQNGLSLLTGLQYSVSADRIRPSRNLIAPCSSRSTRSERENMVGPTLFKLTWAVIHASRFAEINTSQ
jgi:RecA/RadA recombinase